MEKVRSAGNVMKMGGLMVRRLKSAARAVCRRADATGWPAEQPRFTAITAGWGRSRKQHEPGAAVEVIATFVGVLGRLDAARAANHPASPGEAAAAVRTVAEA